MTRTEKRVEFFRRYCMYYLEAYMRGIKLLPFSYHRTLEEQEKLFKDKKTKCDGVVKKSKHQYWLAIDNAPIGIDGKLVWDGNAAVYGELYEIAHNNGLETGWLWSFKDPGHVQWPDEEDDI